MKAYQVCIIFFLLLLSCTRQKTGVYPDTTPLTESVYASVTIQPDSLYEVYAAVAGILQQNLVSEGDTVSKGQPLFQIVNNTPLLQVENAKLNLELAQKNLSGEDNMLDELKSQIRTARLQYYNDSVNFERQRRLWEQGIGSKNTFDQKKLAYELSGNQLSLLQQQYHRTERELLTSLQKAENNYATSRISKDEFTVTSRINGKVYAVHKEPGELITQQHSLGNIGSMNTFIIELMVDEKDIVRVLPGQEVVIALDAYGKETFHAKITRILPEKNERNQSFLVEAEFNNPPQRLYAGLAGEANIITAHKNNALTIPSAYLVNDTLVRTKDGLIRVETGMRSLDKVEILSGIDENTELLKPGT
ncbi:HlyD family efflux transporter periplasmic adaptor subunit [Robertkochia marina]|uniref:HlyD family efflux transporter periplasmic adaptor subunit n=1 Tax=Robertkochia marina TaxID=1227945 RepID=A0A4S3M3S0_9FLAO|nr:efflux RND transporter periplasmic adaptor subunit [Robertkochia marina]THD69832.1 HlyD family efflux transporter periplasmic adaptor subunit [Robertkochia marina]TRZ46823.1 HlyD family efflux transporter periplasmic adaptor subunit [Robertkochia marina]